MSYKIKTLLFIPVYNCENTIVKGLKRYFFKEKNFFFDQVLFIDNKSKDKTILKIKQFIKKIKNKNKKTRFTILKNNKNYNYGGSNKIAFNYASKNKFDYLFISSGDHQGFIGDLVNSFKKEHKKNKSFFGVRFHQKANLNGYSKKRIFANIVINKLFSICMKTKINDLGCGQTIINCRYLKNEFYLKFPDGLYFTYYLTLYHLLNSKLEFKFINIRWRESKGESSVVPLKHIFEIFKLLFKITFLKKILDLKHSKNIKFYKYKTINIK